MTLGISLRPSQIAILDMVATFPGLTINEISKWLNLTEGTIVYRVNILESHCLLKSKKTEEGRMVYLPEDYPKQAPVTLSEIKERLVVKFLLDELDLKLLEGVKGDESISELSKMFNEVENQIAIRLRQSIPVKFSIKTETQVQTFEEAKAIFLKLLSESTENAATSLVV